MAKLPSPYQEEETQQYINLVDSACDIPIELYQQAAQTAQNQIENAGGSCFAAEVMTTQTTVREVLMLVLDLNRIHFVWEIAGSLEQIEDGLALLNEADDSETAEYITRLVVSLLVNIYTDLDVEDACASYVKNEIIDKGVFKLHEPQNKVPLMSIFNSVKKEGLDRLFERYNFLVEPFANRFVTWLLNQRTLNQRELASPLRVQVESGKVNLLVPCNGFYSQLFSRKAYTDNSRGSKQKSTQKGTGTYEIDFFEALKSFFDNAQLNLTSTFVENFIKQIRAKILELHQTGELPKLLGPLEKN